MLRETIASRISQEDIRGSKLYGLKDEKLGKIDDVIFDHFTGSISYVVVDTGGWLSTKKFIVPARRLKVSTEHKDDFAVDLNKQQVEAFPPYQESDLESDEAMGRLRRPLPLEVGGRSGDAPRGNRP